MTGLLGDKVALITGAGHGIGAAAAMLFAAEGAAVCVADIDVDAARRVAGQITEAGGVAAARHVDVTDAGQVDELRSDVFDQFGHVDVLVNNVGHWVHVPATFADSDPAHWQSLYEINLLHVLRVTHAFVPSMVAR